MNKRNIARFGLCMVLAGGIALGADAKKEIIVDKPKYKLHVVEGSDTLATYGVCLGENKGQKKRAGDHKTPEGDFKISSIEDSSDWPHKNKEGKKVKGMYGPWFFRIKCPQSKHIGIHGTSEPESIGTRASEGCIRLRNSDLLELKQHVYVGMPVHILKD